LAAVLFDIVNIARASTLSRQRPDCVNWQAAAIRGDP
jgi:hypothetical protein